MTISQPCTLWWRSLSTNNLSSVLLLRRPGHLNTAAVFRSSAVTRDRLSPPSFHSRRLYSSINLATPSPSGAVQGSSASWRRLPVVSPVRLSPSYFSRQLTNSIPSRTFFTANAKSINGGGTPNLSLFFTSQRHLSTLNNHTHTPIEPKLPTLSPPIVSKWLLGCSALVFAIIVIGGVTRLTESGLSITEWKPFTGTIPPLTQAQWEEEFEKYKETPEFKLLNSRMELSDFKKIFFWEYSHRLLGRVIGLTYIIPFLYFFASKRLTKSLPTRLTGLGLLLGFQGALGWYMVKSGLDQEIMTTPGAVPRVSQYRLAAHLGAALVLYAGMLSTGLAVLSDWKWANLLGRGDVNAVAANKMVDHASSLNRFLATGVGKRFRLFSYGLIGLVFITALSGAFVAGLDAGLLYNEFPMMGGRLVPPGDELFNPAYAKSADKSDLWWRNLLENPTTVQFDHRVLAMSTYGIITGFYFTCIKSQAIKSVLPALTKRALTGVWHAANLQVLLGITTLLYLVPIPLAAAHQAGSVVLLSTVVALAGTLRRPGRVAQVWREAAARMTTRRSPGFNPPQANSKPSS